MIIRGQLQRREKKDRDGKTSEVFEVIVEHAWFVGSRGSGTAPSQKEPAEDFVEVEEDADLPFD